MGNVCLSFGDSAFDVGGDEVVEDGDGGDEVLGVVDVVEWADAGSESLDFLDCRERFGEGGLPSIHFPRARRGRAGGITLGLRRDSTDCPKR